MKLVVTARYLLKAKLNKAFLCNIFLLLFIHFNAFSQDYKLTFSKDTPLSEALLQSSRIFNFRVAYDAHRLHDVNARDEASGNTIDELLLNLLRESGFKFIYKHGSYLIIEDEAYFHSLKECQLMGAVIDIETGEQLPFATITLPEQNIIATAYTNGTFSIKNIISNPMHIVVSYIGYHTTDTLLNWTGPYIKTVFRLKQKIAKINQVEVIQSKAEIIENRNDVDFVTTINPAKLIDMPVLAETDVFRTLQLLPGIRYSENTSELSIRGGTSDQNLVLFDGQTLYNLSHYYGVFSSINPNIIKDIQVYKGGFDSRYGERISGIIDITSKTANRMKPAISADINLLSVNLAVEVPVTKRLTVIAAGRRSYSDIYKTSFADKLFNKYSPSLNDKPDETTTVSEPFFHFYDLNCKLNYRISDHENIFLSLYGGKDFFKNDYALSSHSMYVTNSDSNSWYNYGASVNWQKQWNTAFFSSILVGNSGYNNIAYNSTAITKRLSSQNEQLFLPKSQDVFIAQSNNKLKDFSLSIRNTFTLNSFNQLNFGLLIRKNEIDYYKNADQIYVYDNTRQSSWVSSLYAQDRITVLKNVMLKPGFRITYFEGTHNFYFEPRFAALYNFSDNFRARFAAGQYNQFISQVQSQQETGYSKNFWILSNDSVNPILKAKHFILGLTYNRTKIILEIEGYYKQYLGLQEYIYLPQFMRNTEFDKYFPAVNSFSPPSVGKVPNLPSYFISGSGKSFGIDFLASFSSPHYTNWISYSLSRNIQTFDSINHGEEFPALTDQKHQISFSNLFTVGKLNLGVIGLFATGRPFIVFAESKMNLPVIRQYKRLPNYFRCDLSANYNFLIKAIRLKTGISVINLFNSQNYFDVNARTFDIENTSFSGTNLIQSQKLSLNIFLRLTL